MGMAYVCSMFDAGIELYPANIGWSAQFANADSLPISSGKVRIGGASGWRVVQQLLQLCLGQGGLTIGTGRGWMTTESFGEALAVALDGAWSVA